MITFSTKVYPNITMYRADALAMIDKMGLSATVPGSILAADVPQALERLTGSVGTSHTLQQDAEDGVSPSTRAAPLIELLQAAMREHKNVMWAEAGLLD
jgi:hypothetical protein